MDGTEEIKRKTTSWEVVFFIRAVQDLFAKASPKIILLFFQAVVFLPELLSSTAANDSG